MSLLFIFVGAGLGGLLRYGVSNAVYQWLGALFPYGTLLVNISGSLLMGFLFVVIADRFMVVAPALRALLLIGFLGGYTTFSSFSIEAVNLLEAGQLGYAVCYVLLSVVGCVAAAWVGVLLGEQI